tara:strand:+ start:6438 stop:9626 length:3189 start_codon:yes stop_codon:yes gene_type:complete
MAEQTFKSPGFFEREIEVISRPLVANNATPVGIIGPALKGPAFVPTTVYNETEFYRIFGSPDPRRPSLHAAAEYFRNGGEAVTFCRVLGGGSGQAQSNGGFEVKGEQFDTNNLRAKGSVQFIVANHDVNDAEHITVGMLNDNDSIKTDGDENLNGIDALLPNSDNVQLVRAMIFMEKDHTLRVSAATENSTTADTDDLATVNSDKKFKVYIHNETTDTLKAEYTVSLDPDSDSYIEKVLNTDQFKLEDKGHYLYAHFPVDDQVASVADTLNVASLKGTNASDRYNDYGNFKSSFKTPKTTKFISQPFGSTEYDLFHIESLDDGEYASKKYKLSIADLRASTDPNYKYGTFTVQLRSLYDTDDSPVILESYSRCSLDPNSDSFVARVIGDQKLKLALDAASEDERRLIREGTFENKSSRIRVVMSDDVLRGEVPDTALPFGFRGIPFLKTTSTGKDAGSDATANSFLEGKAGTAANENNIDSITSPHVNQLNFGILPPLPYRMKVTTGDMRNASEKYFQTYLGHASENSESTKSNLYWGLNTSRVTDINNPNKPNNALAVNKVVENLTKLLGNDSELYVSGSAADAFNNNKFSLAKVAFKGDTVALITGTVLEAFREAVYVRNADVSDDPTKTIYNEADNTILMSASSDPFSSEIISGNPEDKRATLAKLLAEDKTKFNKYSSMAKFTAPFYGGFDGVNIMDKDAYYFTDRAASTDSTGGKAASVGYASGLSQTNDATTRMQGDELENNIVASYMNAIRVMTDEMIVDHNVLTVPGIRDSIITDYATTRTRDYGKAIYLMDIPHYTAEGNRLFTNADGMVQYNYTNTKGRADVDETSSKFEFREVNSSYVASYFPDVMIEDSGDDENAAQTNRRRVRVPSSVVALGALARTDSISQPWFAPAGFSRGSLESVSSIDVRLNSADRDTLYEARINPIANFPNNQFVIFGQKTTQIARTALDRVNVRRLMIAIKRRIQKIAQGLLFAQNDAQTRADFVTRASQQLAQIQINQGIEDFRVIMDDTNNSDEDVDNHRLNGKIIVVPTRAVEFIAMDFIITNSGVEFPS